MKFYPVFFLKESGRRRWLTAVLPQHRAYGSVHGISINCCLRLFLWWLLNILNLYSRFPTYLSGFKLDRTPSTRTIGRNRFIPEHIFPLSVSININSSSLIAPQICRKIIRICTVTRRRKRFKRADQGQQFSDHSRKIHPAVLVFRSFHESIVIFTFIKVTSKGG